MEGMIFVIIAVLTVCAALMVYQYLETRKRKERIRELSAGAVEVSPNEFFSLRKSKDFGQSRVTVNQELNFPGVYVIFNATKNMHYIGQGTKTGDRVNAHFTGKGNGDVYADYKYGDSFTIKLIQFQGSGYATMNELERDTIMTYNARATGYNKTRGNS